MQQIERSKLITYRWWRVGATEIKPAHVLELEDRADERIAEMMAQGYTSGELNDYIRTTPDDPEDGVEYTGWWVVSTPNDGALPQSESDVGSNPLLTEALEAIDYAEAIMSEDVLNAVTGDYAADHCIYDAIDLLRTVMEKAKGHKALAERERTT